LVHWAPTEGQKSICLRRREFIALLGGAAAWPLAVCAQEGGRLRRIGVLTGGDENDPAQKRRLSAFTQALADLGWTDGRNVRVDIRWAGGAGEAASAGCSAKSFQGSSFASPSFSARLRQRRRTMASYASA
jgi:hypothetical protein